MTSTVSAPAQPTLERIHRRFFAIRAACWLTALALGALQAWTARFAMNPDGISYLDIGDAYWRHDWHNAINAYWSPLYSWILGSITNVAKPGPTAEYPLVHVINLGVLAFSFGCFEYLLLTLLGRARDRNGDYLEQLFYTFGFSVFLMSSLVLIGIRTVSPDMLAAGIFFLATAMLAQFDRVETHLKRFAILGAVLGVGFFSRAVMFPLGFIFVAALALRIGISRGTLGRIALTLGAFLAVSSPFIAALSLHQHRLTFGEAGTWNYAFYVNRAPFWTYSAYPNQAEHVSSPLAPEMKTLSNTHFIYDFRGSAGTFPPWFDPTHWSRKLQIRYSFGEILSRLLEAGRFFSYVLAVDFLPAVFGMVVLLLTTPLHRITGAQSKRNLWVVPAFVTCVAYAIIHVETRHIAGSLAVLILATALGLAKFSQGRIVRAFLASAAALLTLMTCIACFYAGPQPGSEYAPAAIALKNAGLQPEDRIALIWDERWESGAAEGSFVPRLLRLKIIAEIPNAASFWKLDEGARQHAIDILRNTGARAILAFDVPVGERAGWQQLGNTNYYVFSLATSVTPQPKLPSNASANVVY